MGYTLWLPDNAAAFRRSEGADTGISYVRDTGSAAYSIKRDFIPKEHIPYK